MLIPVVDRPCLALVRQCREKKKLLEFHELLSAEMKTLSTNSEAEILEKPAAKFLQSNGSTTSPLKKSAAGDKACKFWGSDDGCRLGKQCRFVHGEREDKNRPCWLCSALSHRRSECQFSNCFQIVGRGEWFG